MAGITQEISSVSIDNHSRAAVDNFHAPVYLGKPESETTYVVVEHSTRLTSSVDIYDVLSLLPTAADAPFNAYQRKHDPICLPDTRVGLLREYATGPTGKMSDASSG